ncbi:MAG: hypothetical protein PHY34_03880 [Patescibacteria group bacterium]|nr:hypothetical protein [Patescibacteria group bacterium]
MKYIQHSRTILPFLTLILIGFVLLQIPFTNIIGSNLQFSLFDFFAPTIGACIASVWGAIAVVCVKIVDAVVHNQQFDAATIIRLFPLALAALYFGIRKYRPLVALVPIICMALFIVHPQGRGAWFYSLYWLIPLAASFLPQSLTMRSLGATFTAHAVGSVAFLYAFNLPSEVWIALIPVVFLERALFTGGTVVSYLAFNSVVSFCGRWRFASPLKRLIGPDFTFSRKLLVRL